MKNVLTELQNITNREEKHLLQVDSSFRREDLEKYINSSNNTSFKYKIYYNNELFKDRLDDLIVKHSLNVENKIILEFKIDESLEFSVDMKNKISCFTFKDGFMYIGIYSENMKVRNMIDGSLEEIPENDVRMINYQDKLVLYKKNELVVGREKMQFLDSVTAVFQYEDKVFIGTHEGNCYWIDESLNKIKASLDGKIIGIYEREEEDVVVFICITGLILKFNLIDNKTIMVQNKFYPTSFSTSSTFKIFGTSKSCLKLYDFEDRLLKEVEIPIRYSEYIKALDNSILFIAGQYDVIVFDVERGLTINKLYFDSEISGMEVYEERFFVSYGNKIDGFKIKNILEG